jgi:competence ComEA-like helix-hairpin-helix protein
MCANSCDFFQKISDLRKEFMKNKGLAIAAVIGVAAAYIIVFNAVLSVPKADLPSVNTVFYGNEYIAAGENNGVQTVYTGNAYEGAADVYTETAYEEAIDTYTETAYEEGTETYTETAYDGATESHTETAYGLINLNTATLDELITLDGIGEVIAGRIIEYRETYGFRTVEELKNINGIGDVKYAKIVSRVTV